MCLVRQSCLYLTRTIYVKLIIVLTCFYQTILIQTLLIYDSRLKTYYNCVKLQLIKTLLCLIFILNLFVLLLLLCFNKVYNLFDLRRNTLDTAFFWKSTNGLGHGRGHACGRVHGPPKPEPLSRPLLINPHAQKPPRPVYMKSKIIFVYVSNIFLRYRMKKENKKFLFLFLNFKVTVISSL